MGRACNCVCVSICLQLISMGQPREQIFRMTGPGADQDPKGLFTIDMNSGTVSVSRSVDREASDSYQVSMCLSRVQIWWLSLFHCFTDSQIPRHISCHFLYFSFVLKLLIRFNSSNKGFFSVTLTPGNIQKFKKISE